ncbi:MAG: hypothetical protein AAB354_17405 [candidate division KSB1 bacterium]
MKALWAKVLKAYMFQKQQAKFLSESVRVYFDPSTKQVFLFDSRAKMAKLEYSELKQWAMCLRCGVKGFVEGEEPRFANDTTCAACASQEEASHPMRASKRSQKLSLRGLARGRQARRDYLLARRDGQTT